MKSNPLYYFGLLLIGFFTPILMLTASSTQNIWIVLAAAATASTGMICGMLWVMRGD